MKTTKIRIWLARAIIASLIFCCSVSVMAQEMESQVHEEAMEEENSESTVDRTEDENMEEDTGDNEDGINMADTGTVSENNDEFIDFYEEIEQDTALEQTCEKQETESGQSEIGLELEAGQIEIEVKTIAEQIEYEQDVSLQAEKKDAIITDSETQEVQDEELLINERKKNEENEEKEESEHKLRSNPADNRIKVTSITGSTSDFASIPKFGAEVTLPHFSAANDGLGGKSGAFFDVYGNSSWCKFTGTDLNDPFDWEQKWAGSQFTSGKWRYMCSIRLDQSVISQYKIGEELTVSINGVPWDVEVYTWNDPNCDTWAFMKSPIIEIEEPSGFYFLNDSSYEDRIYLTTVGEPITPFSVAGSVYGGTKPYHFSSPDGPEWLDVSDDGVVSGTPWEATQEPDNGQEDLVIWVWSYVDGEYINRSISIPVGCTRAAISTVKATSNSTSVVVSGKTIQIPKFSTTEGAPAYLDEIHAICAARRPLMR